MSDILSLPVSTPVAPALGGALVLPDGALASASLTADPFAAFLATAQATPSPVATQPIAILPYKLATVRIADDGAPDETVETERADGDVAEPTGDSTTPVLVDPTLSPALAMLSALTTTEPNTPRLSPDALKSRPAIAPTQLAPTPAGTIVATVATASPTAALPIVAPAGPTSSTPDVPSTEAIASTVVTAPTVATAVATVIRQTDAPSADRPAVKTRQLVYDSPAPAQIAVAPAALTPAAPEIVERAIAAGMTAPLAAKGAVADDTTTPAETETAIAAEVTLPPQTRAASPIKPRIARADSDAAPAPERGERARPATPALGVPTNVARDIVREPVLPAPVAVSIETTKAAAPPAPVADLLVQRQLIIAEDGRWLDSLARDIAHSASGETMQFRLEPVNLGSLTVSIAQGSDGTAIRMTAETHHARDILVEAQPALIAEARANGLRISETHVDLNSTNRDSGNANGNTSSSGGQPSFANNSAGQQAMRQDGNGRRQPDLPAPLPNRTRSADADALARDSGERFA